MTVRIERRTLLATAMFGVGALAIPGFARAFTLWQATGFTHSVASGEPHQRSMLFWTRYVPADRGEARVRVEVSPTEDFSRVVGEGVMVTGPWRDHTAKITVGGLEPGTDYHYRFVAPDGSFSPTGRTRTLPEGPAKQFRMAVFSCSNIGFGYFNSYRAVAADPSIDLAFHTGDYFYEHRIPAYPVEAEIIDNRRPLPEHEIVSLTDYRLRYASYRADPDLQALHASKPVIASMDDHESANDSWEGGAQAHQKDEGEWHARRAAALQAWLEWMPLSEEPWKAYEIGDLGTIFRTETRLLHRSRQLGMGAVFDAADPAAALKTFAAGPLNDPAATMMGSTQEVWLDAAIARSVQQGKAWQLVGFGTPMAQRLTPPEAIDWLKPNPSDWALNLARIGVEAAKFGISPWLDTWAGYPAARKRFLTGAQQAGANLILVSGDTHNAWASSLAEDGQPAGVEFAGQSVTTPGHEASTAADPKVMAKAMIESSPELRWCDTSRRGHVEVTLTPETARGDYMFADTVATPGAPVRLGQRLTVKHGTNRIA